MKSWCSWLLLVALQASIPGRVEPVLARPGPASFRMGFSQSIFSGVNMNDAKAAVKVWAQTVARERKIPAEPDATIIPDLAALRAAVCTGQVDAVGLTVDEYQALNGPERFDPVFVTAQSGRTNVQYLLLVRREGGIHSLSDLRGKNLAELAHGRTALARTWLDTILTEAGLGRASDVCAHLIRCEKPSAAVLPVFFGQTDACLVDSISFEIMCELNPQLGKQLTPIASSTFLIPVLFAVRRDYAPHFKDELIDTLLRLHQTPAGRQVLMVFQIDQLLLGSPSDLNSALRVLSDHGQLRNGTRQ